MPITYLAVRHDEIERLEFNCPQCKSIIVLPIIKPPTHVTSAGESGFEHCPWCKPPAKPWESAQQSALRMILEGLAKAREANLPGFRFIIQEKNEGATPAGP